MSSSPSVDDHLQVTVKRVPGGVVSNWLNDTLAPGDVVEVTRPAGVFRLGPGDRDIMAFSGGSGITPVLSLLKTALATTSRRVRLLYANRDRDGVIFAEELDDLTERHAGRLEVVHHLDVDRGFVDDDVVRHFTRIAADADYYICGPGPFMDIVEHRLLSDDVDPGRIHIERFIPPEPPAAPASPVAPAALAGHHRTRRPHRHHRAPPGTTVLQTARQMGLSPPFSCESGSCATCMARVVEGDGHHACQQRARPTTRSPTAGCLPVKPCRPSPSVHVIYGYEES